MSAARKTSSDPNEELVSFISVLQEDDALRAWFVSLGQLSASNRLIEIGTLACRMKAEGEDAGLVRTLELLIEPAVFDGVMKTLHEIGVRD